MVSTNKRTFHPTPKEVEHTSAGFGYPTVGKYALMVKCGKILGMEIERPGEFLAQQLALPKYYPSDAELVIATLDSNGVFHEI